VPEPGVILLVDDEPGMRDMLHWALSRGGRRVEQACDGEQALARVEAGGVSLVITDLTMPRRGGLDLLRALSARRPRPAVIVTTGFGTVETAVEAMRLGAADFLLKPFELGALLPRVDACLQDMMEVMPQGRPVG
jgi:DNA-binding NtrC family response regulator